MPLSSAAVLLALAMGAHGSATSGCEPAAPVSADALSGAMGLCSPIPRGSSSPGPLVATRAGSLSSRHGARESTVARAVALAAYGYVSSELRRLDARTQDRSRLAIPRPPEGLAVGPRPRLQRSAWEWVAIAGGIALVAGGIALAVHDLAGAPPAERSRGAAALLTGVRVSFSGDAGWVRFRTRF